jgi:hypothetical protein
MWANLTRDVGLHDAGMIAFAGLIAKNDEELTMLEQGDFFVNLRSSNKGGARK